MKPKMNKRRNEWLIDEGVFVTYKFFNERGERFGIFGKENNGTLELLLIKCSRKDQFCRAEARKAYVLYKNVAGYEFHPTRVDVPILEGNSARWTFMNYCHSNLYKMEQRNVYYIENVIRNGAHVIITGKSRRINKMGY